MARDTRLALLAAAQKSFAARGYGGTSVRQLARAAGIKESSLYNHFASKQELLDAVIERAKPASPPWLSVSMFRSMMPRQLRPSMPA